MEGPAGSAETPPTRGRTPEGHCADGREDSGAQIQPEARPTLLHSQGLAVFSDADFPLRVPGSLIFTLRTKNVCEVLGERTAVALE